MPARPVPRRHWRSYGNDPLPSGIEALDEPFAAFPSWFLRIECDRCGKVQMIAETHMAHGEMLIRDIIASTNLPTSPPSRLARTISRRRRQARSAAPAGC